MPSGGLDRAKLTIDGSPQAFDNDIQILTHSNGEAASDVEEDNKGSIEVGKLADFVTLSGDAEHAAL